jgi:hypothetical protein
MATAEQLRSYAAHLLALVLKAREEGQVELAERLTARASACLDDVTAMEAQPAAADEISRQQASQQQQQPQTSGPNAKKQ